MLMNKLYDLDENIEIWPMKEGKASERGIRRSEV